MGINKCEQHEPAKLQSMDLEALKDIKDILEQKSEGVIIYVDAVSEDGISGNLRLKKHSHTAVTTLFMLESIRQILPQFIEHAREKARQEAYTHET